VKLPKRQKSVVVKLSKRSKVPVESPDGFGAFPISSQARFGAFPISSHELGSFGFVLSNAWEWYPCNYGELKTLLLVNQVVVHDDSVIVHNSPTTNLSTLHYPNPKSSKPSLKHKPLSQISHYISLYKENHYLHKIII